MRTYDNTDNNLHIKSQFNTRQILSNMMRDLADLFFGSCDALLYFLRIAILICGYIVVRPVIEACFRRFMAPPEEMLGEGKEGTQKKQKHKETPRQKSLAEELLVDSDDAEDELNDTPSSHEWGGTLRKRQKARFKEVWEEEQARLAEEEELRELEDILED